jgi:undecaprenyl phosphate-alpha-L-ara4FN deformylase
MTEVGLRIDVDTLRGTRLGVPNLLLLLARENIKATIFFSVGPDNMGRHLWRLLRPAFLIKMLRTKAASLYGWDILLRGTFWPGPLIGKQTAAIMRQAAAAGHEIGLHAWDHQRWQSRIDKMGPDLLHHDIKRGYDCLQDILGEPPTCFAAPAWRITTAGLKVLSRFKFAFVANCRGDYVFRPLSDTAAATPLHIEIPTTLPTYDEIIGQQCTSAEYNKYLLDLIKPEQLNVLTIHAEVEGIFCQDLFADFLTQARARKITFKPLRDFLPPTADIPSGRIRQITQTGREGWIAVQE